MGSVETEGRSANVDDGMGSEARWRQVRLRGRAVDVRDDPEEEEDGSEGELASLDATGLGFWVGVGGSIYAGNEHNTINISLDSVFSDCCRT